LFPAPEILPDSDGSSSPHAQRCERLYVRLEWKKPLSIGPQFRGFFDVAGQFQGPDLLMNRPNEQGIRFKTGPFIDSATVTLRWAERKEFEAACRSSGNEP
jgi:hypothetical protein